MSILRIVISAALVGASVANAQYGGGAGGGAGQRHSPMAIPARQAEPVADLNAKNLNKLDPAKAARDHNSELALQPEQLRQLDSLIRVYEDSSRHFGKGGDTLRNLLRPSQSVSRTSRFRDDPRPETHKDTVEFARKDSIRRADADRDALRRNAARGGLDDLLLRIRAMYDSSSAATIRILTEDQRAKLTEFLEGDARAMSELLHVANVMQLQPVRR